VGGHRYFVQLTLSRELAPAERRRFLAALKRKVLAVRARDAKVRTASARRLAEPRKRKKR